MASQKPAPDNAIRSFPPTKTPADPISSGVPSQGGEPGGFGERFGLPRGNVRVSSAQQGSEPTGGFS